jgi:hypothetical protein
MKELVKVTRSWRNLVEGALGLRRFTIRTVAKPEDQKIKTNVKSMKNMQL